MLYPILCCFFFELIFSEKEADSHVAPTINRAHLLASSVFTIALSLALTLFARVPGRNNNSSAALCRWKRKQISPRYRKKTASDLS